MSLSVTSTFVSLTTNDYLRVMDESLETSRSNSSSFNDAVLEILDEHRRTIDSLSQEIDGLKDEKLDEKAAVTSRSNDSPGEANNKQTFTVTAYTAGYESTGKQPGDKGYGITASGNYVQDNHTVACSEIRPFGTQVYIPYFDTTFTCEDRGGAIAPGKLDVYMSSLEEARQFGKRNLEVIFLD